MSSRRKVEKLTHVQLQQKVIHLESELKFCRENIEMNKIMYLERLSKLKQSNEKLKRDIHNIYHQGDYFDEEQEQLIADYNTLVQANADLQATISKLEAKAGPGEQEIHKIREENESLTQWIDGLKKEITAYRKNEENHKLEKQRYQNELEALRQETKKTEHAREKEAQWLARIQELESTVEKYSKDLKKLMDERKQAKQMLVHFIPTIEKLRGEFLEGTNGVSSKSSLIEQMESIGSVCRISLEKMREWKQEALEKNELLNEEKSNVEKMGRDFHALQEKQEQIKKQNVSYKRSIDQLVLDRQASIESTNRLQTELEHANHQIKALELQKVELNEQVADKEERMKGFEKDHQSLQRENATLLKQIAHLEAENASFQDHISELSSQKQSDDQRIDKITANLNEVFSETKQLVRMTSSLKHQLESKNKEIQQMKEEKEMLMLKAISLKEDYEKSEAQKNELENQIEVMRTELLKAQDSLSRLEQFETEKLKLKEDLESKIQEFTVLTDHYQQEKESYLHVLEHVQDQVNVYKEKSEKFDSEKGSWSKQIDELKAELLETKATIVKMEELEKNNVKLAADLQAKEMELFKTKKDSERALMQQVENFKSDIHNYQEKINQYEKDRESWENQMKKLTAQYEELESSMKEKENFIRQYIKQPLSPPSTYYQQTEPPKQHPETQPRQQTPLSSLPSQPSQPQTEQPINWFQRSLIQQQSVHKQVEQNNQNTKAQQATPMDFFTLRSKTTQPTNPNTYGNP